MWPGIGTHVGGQHQQARLWGGHNSDTWLMSLFISRPCDCSPSGVWVMC